MALTERLALTPQASVSGFYLAHPEATCFNVGRIGDDQIADEARRTGMEEAEARRGLLGVVQGRRASGKPFGLVAPAHLCGVTGRKCPSAAAWMDAGFPKRSARPGRV